MSFSYGMQSKSRLIGVHPGLVRVAYRGLEISRVDWMVVQGVRTDEEAYTNFGKGRTVAQCVAAGCPTKYARPTEKQVTWVAHPLSTKHRRQADGYGHAIDLLPAPYDWKDGRNFDDMAAAMMQAAKEEKVGIRWGADWDGDGKAREAKETDLVHFELLS